MQLSKFPDRLTMRHHLAAVAFLSLMAVSAINNIAFLTNHRGQLPGLYDGPASIIGGAMTERFEALYDREVWFRNSAVDLMARLEWSLFGEPRTGVIIGRGGVLFTIEEFESRRDASVALSNFSDQVAAMVRELRSHDAQVFIALIPPKADIESEALPDGVKLPREPGSRYERLRAALMDRGLQVPPTRETFLDRRARGLDVFLANDTHWLPGGAESMARVIARAAAPPDDPTLFVIREGEPKPHIGDLTKFLNGTDANIDRSVMLVSPQAVAAGDTKVAQDDLFGDVEIPVVLVGTSYSANEDFGFAAHLRAALSRDVLNVAQEGKGPLAPMARYLEGLRDGDEAAPMVVWEIPTRYALDRLDGWEPLPADID